MSFGHVGFGSVGEADRPSPSIWADCPLEELNDLGTGFYFHNGFNEGTDGTLAAALDVTMANVGPAMHLVADTDTVLAHQFVDLGSSLDIETDGDDNDGWAVHSFTFGKLVKNSGKKLWWEAYTEVGAVADQGYFVGIAEAAAFSQDIIADNCAALIGESYVGYRILAGDTDAFDLAYKKDGGTEVEILADVTNATAIPEADRAAVTANTPVKLGMRFDGRETLYFYVNGVLVATDTLDATYDQSKIMGLVIALKTGSAAAQSAQLHWARAGYLDDG
jgi:hypothetical protein